MVALVLLLFAGQAQAAVDPVFAVNDIFAALNSGDVDTAAALFAEDATAENTVRRESYRGVNEIRQMLQRMERDGRRFDIIELQMYGNTITAQVEISDGGLVWGTESIEAVVNDGQLQSFSVKAIRLEL
jgi:ketosteroid isomerase-like protein